MSHIPNSAIPHAAPKAQDEGGETSVRERAGKLADKARSTAKANPKTAIAASVAVAAGAIAAAAIPLVKAARKKADGKAPSTRTKASKPKKAG